MQPRELMELIASYAAEKKAIDVVVVDLREVVGYTDYFLICSGNTSRQTKAIHDGILEGLKRDHQLLPRRVEGASGGDWILMDYLDTVVHIFTPQARDYYRLEELWGEAPASAAPSQPASTEPSQPAPVALAAIVKAPGLASAPRTAAEPA
jgi:ribosome-associated protein